jgi:thiol-disulfide isomerase/thioredoxin
MRKEAALHQISYCLKLRSGNKEYGRPVIRFVHYFCFNNEVSFSIIQQSMKKYRSLLLLLLVVYKANSQVRLQGHIGGLNDNRYAIYVYELTWPITTVVFADSFAVNKKGYFGGRLKPKYANGTIFKAAIYHNGQPVNPLKDAALSNTILFTNSGATSITLTVAADTLFYDAKVQTASAACRQITRLEALKKPLYRAMQQVTGSNDSGQSNMVQLAYNKFIAAIEEYRQAIKQQFARQKIPAVALLCLYNLSLTQTASITQLDTALLYAFIRNKQFPKTTLAEKLLEPFRNQIIGSRWQTGHIKVTAVNGIQKKLAELATGDTIAVINCWASWCGPCRRANRTYLPGFANQLAAKGIVFCSISIDADTNNWKKAITDDIIKWPQYIDGTDRKMYKQLGLSAVPYYAVINKSGNVIFETNTWLQLNEYITAYTKKK